MIRHSLLLIPILTVAAMTVSVSVDTARAVTVLVANSAQPAGGEPSPSAGDICPILPGDTIPPLILRDLDGKPFDLNAAIARKPTLLIIYRGGWCPYCNRQLNGLQEIEPTLIELGYQIIAISPDRPEKLKPTIEKYGLDYMLLSDSKLEAALALGLAFKVDEETVNRYKNRLNIDLEDASGEQHHLLPVPAAFVVGTDGMITFEYVNPNYKVRADPDVLLAAAKAALKK